MDSIEVSAKNAKWKWVIDSFNKNATTINFAKPDMRELKKIAANPAIELGKEIIKNPLMSSEEWTYKYGKNGVVTKAYKQAWEDIKEGVKVVVDWIKGVTEEPTQYEKEQFTALDKKQEERTRKMIKELKKK
jgi:hypothetical protein